MKTMKVLVTILSISLIILAFGCGRNRNNVRPSGEPVYYPEWWNSQNDEAYVCTYGNATRVSETLAMETAKNQALATAAQYVEVEVQAMMKVYEEEAGVIDPQLLQLSQNVIRSVTQARFSGIVYGRSEVRQVVEQNTPRYKVWVQAKIPKTEIARNTARLIRNEEALYNQFRASQAFMELDELLD
ncbi:MAG TPA: hypothetical protein PLX59_03280 [Candidatus Cloacimonadota bacterium]|nr:hypothetical protein [Candidatus Cloacimonadota bacterium]